MSHALPSFARLSALAALLPLAAAQTRPAAPDPDPLLLEPVTVLGTAAAMNRLPGAGTYIPSADFRASGYLAFSKIAAKTPGVYVREEDGYGNFITVSIRGVDSNRSTKVTLMEDGILASPSAYSAPAAYYSPKLGRMSGIEILKGSSQIAYGPHTTGGVINFLSTPIPATRAFSSRTTYGTENTLYNHTHFGDRLTTAGGGALGYLLEVQAQQTDGFRRIDGTTRTPDFTLVEPMLKLFWEPGAALPQRFELKIGHTQFDARETYSGLTVADLRANPDRRYAASQFDDFSSTQWRTYLKHVIQPTPNLRLDSALYHNTFERNWDKLDGLRGDGLRTNVAQALAHAPSRAVLQGLGDGKIFTRDAFRDHESSGFQTQLAYDFTNGDLEHAFELGARLHDDSATGTNQQIFRTSNGTGGFGPAAPAAVQNAGRQEVTALALFAEHAFTVGRLTVVPGTRVEFLDWTNRTGTGVRSTGNESFTTGGLGFTFEVDAANALFGGIHRGASVPNAASFLAGANTETSLNYELGLRHRRDSFRAEFVGFLTEVSDLLAPQIATGGGGLTPTRNGGDARISGLEALLEYDLGRATGSTLGLPFYASATWTQAEFTGIPIRLGNGAGLFAGGRNGNAIPYVPEWKLAAGLALENDAWTLRLDASHVTATWGTGYNGDPRLNDNGTPANPTLVDGRIDSLFLLDLTGHYQVNDHLRLLAGVQNLLDERAITSRAPLGPRANAPRWVFVGAELTF